MSIVDELPDEQYGPVFELVDTNEQATSSKKYAQFYRSKSYNTTTGAIHWHLQIGTTITSVKENIDISGKDKEICILESIGVQDAESVELGNKYNSSRHRVKNINEDGSCDAGYEKYKKTTRVCEIDAKNPAGSFCDKFPKTAFQLANIVNILQILVPALVIIFTGVEIGKIVIAGNVEEELPKRKQSIIIRLIIMVVFLFLRLIVSLIIALANGVMIADVGCLFEDGINETEGNELKCYNESDDSQ